MCPTCFRFVSIGDMCAIAQIESAIYCHTCMHCIGICLGDRPAVDKLPSVDEVRPKVLIRDKEFFVPKHYPKDASGRLEYDKKLPEELDTKTMDVLRNMCKHNLPAAQPTYKDKRRTSSTGVCFATSCKAHVCAPIYIYIYTYIYDIKAPTLAMALPGCLVLLLVVLFPVPPR